MIALLTHGAPLFGAAQQMPATEYQVKAIFLFNFTQFIEWPTDTFNKSDSQMVIGVMGLDPFGSLLDDAVKGEVVNGHPLVVRRCSNYEEAQNCQILFIKRLKNDKLDDLLAGLKGKRVLTVGEDPDFARHGGMVRFFMRDNKVRIQINLAATRASDLTISSKLLRLAEVNDSTNDNR